MAVAEPKPDENTEDRSAEEVMDRLLEQAAKYLDVEEEEVDDMLYSEIRRRLRS